MNFLSRQCGREDLGEIFLIVNDAAVAYRGVIPADCWKEPYMPREKLEAEISAGVRFWGCEEDGRLLGVMGLQLVQDVALIRHAYVRTSVQHRGIGGRLMTVLLRQTDRPMLVGTWAAATWAIHFYEQHEFKLVTRTEKDRLLKKYWSISERQIETSVVLADAKWQRAEGMCRG
jgi:N-acetylglutamate synthase-like GNAT family acetyltransferase